MVFVAEDLDALRMVDHRAFGLFVDGSAVPPVQVRGLGEQPVLARLLLVGRRALHLDFAHVEIPRAIHPCHERPHLEGVLRIRKGAVPLGPVDAEHAHHILQGMPWRVGEQRLRHVERIHGIRMQGRDAAPGRFDVQGRQVIGDVMPDHRQRCDSVDDLGEHEPYGRRIQQIPVTDRAQRHVDGIQGTGWPDQLTVAMNDVAAAQQQRAELEDLDITAEPHRLSIKHDTIRFTGAAKKFVKIGPRCTGRMPPVRRTGSRGIVCLRRRADGRRMPPYRPLVRSRLLPKER